MIAAVFGSAAFRALFCADPALGSTIPAMNRWSRGPDGSQMRDRRVTVKARIVKLDPQRGAARGRSFVSAKAVDAHLRYLERDARKITREDHEVAREIANTRHCVISMKLRMTVEMLFAHLKHILGLGRLRLRGPCGAIDELPVAATAQTLRKLAKIFPAPRQASKAGSESASRHVQSATFRARNALFFRGIS